MLNSPESQPDTIVVYLSEGLWTWERRSPEGQGRHGKGGLASLEAALNGAFAEAQLTDPRAGIAVMDVEGDKLPEVLGGE